MAKTVEMCIRDRGYARQVVEQYELMEAKYISKEQSRKKFSVSMQHYTFAVNALSLINI